MNNIEYEIALMNQIVDAAVEHGADYGGSYCNNEEELVNMLNKWLDFKGYSTWYEVVSDLRDAPGDWTNVVIVKKGE